MITIQQALRPFFLVCFIMGLGVYPVRQSKLKIQSIIYLSILYSLIIWFAYAYLFFYILNYFTLKVICPADIFIVIMVTNIFSLIISIIMNLYYRKKFEICVIKLAAVDDTLEELGTPKMYEKMHILTKRVTIGWIMWSLFLNFYDAVYWLNKKETASWGLFLPLIINYCEHVTTFVDLLFIFFLWYIGTRFDKINNHVQCLLMKEEHGLRCTWKKSVIAFRRDNLCIDNCKRTLWTTMQLHLELCRLTRELNSVFGTQLTLEMTCYLLFVIIMCYNIYVVFLLGYQEFLLMYHWLDFSLWLFLLLAKLCAINYICESVTVKANRIDKIIHQLTNSIRYADFWNEIYQFTLQVMFHPLKLTGMNLFDFGNDFLRKFGLTVVKFLIIMMQLKITIKYT